MFASPRLRRVTAPAVLLALLFTTQISFSRSPHPQPPPPPTDRVEFRVSLDESVNQMWAQMPTDSSAPNVTLSGQTQPDCANSALRKAKVAVTWVGVQAAAIQALAQTMSIAKDILEEVYGVKYVGVLMDVVSAYLQSDSVDDLVQKLGEVAVDQATSAAVEHAGEHIQEHHPAAGNPAEPYIHRKAATELAKALYNNLTETPTTTVERTWDDPNCGPIQVVFELRAGEHGHKTLYFRASGDCHCQWPSNRAAPERMGAFTVIGIGDLAPGHPHVDGTTVVIPYSLASTHYDVLATCGCAAGEPQPGITEGGTGTEVQPPVHRNITEEICERRCHSLWAAWQDEQRLADSLDANARALEGYLAQARSKLEEAQQKLAAAQARLQAANASMERYQSYGRQHGVNPTIFGRSYEEAQTAQRSAQEDVAKYQAQVNYWSAEVARQQTTVSQARANADQELQAAASARDAYYQCTKNCYDQARMADPSTAYPDDVREWIQQHPQQTSERPPSTRPGTATMVGVVVPNDCRPGERCSGRVVEDPKNFQGMPALRVVEMTVPVRHGDDGKPMLEELKLRIGDGLATDGSSCATGNVPAGGNLEVSLASGDSPAVTERISTATGALRRPAEAIHPQDFRTNPVYQPGTTQAISGPFTGSTFPTRISVGGKPAEILAESPGAVYFRVPSELPPGASDVVCEEGTTTATLPVSVLQLDMNADRLHLEKGETTAFHVVISGPDRLPESAWSGAAPPSDLLNLEELRRLAPHANLPAPGKVLVIIQNASPDVVSMQGARGEVVVLELDRSAFAAGPYRYNGMLRSKRAGGFVVNATVVSFLAPVAGK